MLEDGKRIRLKVVLILLVLCMAVILSCQQKSAEDDDEVDSDDDTDQGNIQRPQGLPECKPYQERIGWFGISYFEDVSVQFTELFGEHFVSGLASVSGDQVTLQLEDLEVNLVWYSPDLQPDIADGQIVKVFVATHDLDPWSDNNPWGLWVLDENGKLLLYHDQKKAADSLEVDGRAISYVTDFECEYYQNRPPLKTVHESWCHVYSRTLSGIVDGQEFDAIGAGEVGKTTDGEYSIYLVTNYYGELDEPILDYGSIVQEFLFQLVKKRE